MSSVGFVAWGMMTGIFLESNCQLSLLASNKHMLHLRIFQHAIHSIVISCLWSFINFQDTNSWPLIFFPLSAPLSSINLLNLAETTSEASLHFQKDFLINAGKAFLTTRKCCWHVGCPGLRSLALKPTISPCLHCIICFPVLCIHCRLSADLLLVCVHNT